MKYFYIIALLLSHILNTPQVEASAVGAGATEPTQWLNNFELVGVNISDAATALSTSEDMLKNTILDPIANGLIASAQQAAADDIVAWVNGGFHGDSLIVSNPGKFIKNIGTQQANIALKQIPVDSIYGDSIFKSIYEQTKADNKDLTAQLEALSKSNIPSILQENICGDASLTELATKDVAANSGDYTEEDVLVRREELYNYACSGDPKTDPEVAKKLDDLYAQQPELGGWDSWLEVTSGGSASVKQAAAVKAVQKKIAEEKTVASNEIFLGAGPGSQKECAEGAWVEEDAEGPGYCKEYITTTPGKQVADALSKAGTASFDRLANIMGSGALVSMLTNLAISKLSQGLNTAVRNTVSGGGSSTSGGDNTAVVTSSTQPARQDLSNDAARKRNLTGPMLKQLDYYNTSLDTLNTTDSSYLADVNNYAEKIVRGRACYDNLVGNGSYQRSDFSDAYSFYSERELRVSTIKETLTSEISKIQEGKQLVNEAKAKIEASNSSQEISSIFSNYTSIVENGGFPTQQEAGQRSGEYRKVKSEIDRDTEINDYAQKCSTLEQQRNQGN